jgi:hypothetical protein
MQDDMWLFGGGGKFVKATGYEESKNDPNVEAREFLNKLKEMSGLFDTTPDNSTWIKVCTVMFQLTRSCLLAECFVKFAVGTNELRNPEEGVYG